MGPARLVLYGYRANEIFKKMDRPDDTVRVYTESFDVQNTRKPVAVSLGMHMEGSALPHADPGDVDTLAEGVKQRMGKLMPRMKRSDRKKFLKGLRKYTEAWLKKRRIKPIGMEENVSIEEWLSKTNYPAWRKEELLKEYESIDNPLERDSRGRLKHFTVKLFMKDEHYIDYKQARGIYAREDNAKLFFGPWFKLMESQIYKQPEFIKHVPVADRPKYIYSKLYTEGGKYLVTDFSSFEAHFREDLMDNCEFVMYWHFLKYHPLGKHVFSVMKEVLQGDNKVVSKYIKCMIRARRMSGEMNTSLGNGFSNLMFMGYVSSTLGIKEVTGVVEGDDGLFVFVGRAPKTEDFTKLGFIIKLEAVEDLAKAGFCGNLFDLNDLQVVTDPFKVLNSFGWTTTRYLRAKDNKLKMLLRCKALSLAHQYPGCPIIGTLAHTALRLTKSFDIKKFVEKRRDLCMYEREKLLLNLSRGNPTYVEPGRGTRFLFEELYGISVESQYKIERYLASLVNIEAIKIDCILEESHHSWRDYFERYSGNYYPQRQIDGEIGLDMGRLWQ